MLTILHYSGQQLNIIKTNQISDKTEKERKIYKNQNKSNTGTKSTQINYGEYQ